MKKTILSILFILAVCGTAIAAVTLKQQDFCEGLLTHSVQNNDTSLSMLPVTYANDFPKDGPFEITIFTNTCDRPTTCAQREKVKLQWSSGTTYALISRGVASSITPTTWPRGSRVVQSITTEALAEYITIGSNCTPTTIDAHAGAAPTADQLSACRQPIITNYGQVASNVTTTLPATAANLGFMTTIGTAQGANYFRVTSAAGGDMYLDGSATGKNYVQFSAPAVGNYFSCFTFQTGASAWSWACASGIGATSTN